MAILYCLPIVCLEECWLIETADFDMIVLIVFVFQGCVWRVCAMSQINCCGQTGVKRELYGCSKSVFNLFLYYNEWFYSCFIGLLIYTWLLGAIALSASHLIGMDTLMQNNTLFMACEPSLCSVEWDWLAAILYLNKALGDRNLAEINLFFCAVYINFKFRICANYSTVCFHSHGCHEKATR